MRPRIANLKPLKLSLTKPSFKYNINITSNFIKERSLLVFERNMSVYTYIKITNQFIL